MNIIYVKLRMREHSNKYRKMLSTEEIVYPSLSELVESSFDYAAGATLENGEWFKIVNASQQPYAIDLMAQNFVKNENTVFFQNVNKSKLVSKKRIGSFGEAFKYENNSEEIIINEYPDAVYCGENDTLYFRKLETITGIFKGIVNLYREATDNETEQFLQSNFIILKNDYGTSNVKTANRKRIALALKTLSELNSEEKSNIFSYIGEYCPDLKTEDNAFSVSSEDELKMVLFGIEQRFYTTLIGGEKRIANSVISMN